MFLGKQRVVEDIEGLVELGGVDNLGSLEEFEVLKTCRLEDEKF